MKKNSQRFSPDEILAMSREELIDFLVDNWSLAKELPAGKERDYFLTRPDFHTMENMQGVALALIGQ